MKSLLKLASLLFVFTCITSCFQEYTPEEKTKIIEIWEAQKVEISYFDYGSQHYDVYTKRKDWEDAQNSRNIYSIPTPYAFILYSDGKYGTLAGPEAFDEFMEDPGLISRIAYKIEGNQFCCVVYSWNPDDYIPCFRILTNNNDTIVLEVITNGYEVPAIPSYADEVSYNCKATFKKRKDF